jgi:AcrR family transcriptional regulator
MSRNIKLPPHVQRKLDDAACQALFACRLRTSGKSPRARLLSCARQLFAANGYSKTSVRDIADAAGLNRNAIVCHFGSKSNLYRAAVWEPMVDLDDDTGPFDDPGLQLEQALTLYNRGTLCKLAIDDDLKLNVCLRMRELLVPSAMSVKQNPLMTPLHTRLVTVLARAMNLGAADTQLETLAITIFVLVAYPFCCDAQILTHTAWAFETPALLDAWSAQLLRSQVGLVQADRIRRVPSRL